MSKTIRDWLFIVFIILFVVITFFVALYAAGYTIKKQWPPRFNSLFEKTGMLIVDSSPTGATVFLNDEKINKSFLINWQKNEVQTPAKIKNLVPGKYTLKLEKEGYWPLEKKIEIRSGQTSFAEDFIMFKKSLPLNITICEPQKFILSNNNKNISLENDKLLIDLKTGSSKLIDTNSDYLNFNLESEAYNLQWDQNKAKLYYQLANQIRCLNVTDNSSQSFLSQGKYLAYTTYQNKLYTVEKIDNNIYLHIYNSENSLLESTVNLPEGLYNFETRDDHLSLYDSKNQSLYLLNNSTQIPITKKLEKVQDWQWIGNTYIVWYNDFEIYSMDISNGRPNLIIRISEKITGLAWNKAKYYLLYSSEKNIWIVNLNLEKIIPINILQAKAINNLSLDEKNQIVYFYADIDDKLGIYKLQLK